MYDIFVTGATDEEHLKMLSLVLETSGIASTEVKVQIHGTICDTFRSRDQSARAPPIERV